MGKTVKKALVMLMVTIVLTVSLVIPVSAATSPSLGSCASSVTLYGNDYNNDHRAMNIKVSNWKNGYTYKAFSNNNAIAKVTDKSVNSKSGVHFTIRAVAKGTTNVQLEMWNGSKLIQSKKIAVTVSSRNISAVKDLKQTGRTMNTISVNWKLTGSNQFVTAYRVQISASPRFESLLANTTVSVNNATFHNLKSGATYYVRVRTESHRNNVSVVTGWQAIRTTTTI